MISEYEATYKCDDVSGGNRKDVGTGDHSGALGFDGRLSLDDRVEAIAGEGEVVRRVLLGVVPRGCNHN